MISIFWRFVLIHQRESHSSPVGIIDDLPDSRETIECLANMETEQIQFVIAIKCQAYGVPFGPFRIRVSAGLKTFTLRHCPARILGVPRKTVKPIASAT